MAQVIGRALRSDHGEIGTFPSALAPDKMAADAAALAKQLLAMRRIARRTLRAALLERAYIGDDLAPAGRAKYVTAFRDALAARAEEIAQVISTDLGASRKTALAFHVHWAVLASQAASSASIRPCDRIWSLMA